MRVTTKGQVTIPRHIREKLGIVPATEIEFVEEKNRVYIVKKKEPGNQPNRFRKLRGVATVRMTTDEIMALTRKEG
jgi:AbrB family looped-hinge helix DNA binding protein